MIEYQYALQLTASLDKVVVKKNNPLLINFRCPVCGDSQDNKNRTRGYIIQESNGKYYFYCHNCRSHMPFAKFMAWINPFLYQQYRMDVFKQSPDKMMLPETFKKKKIHFQNIEKLVKISQLKPTHKARLYLDDRLIPTKCHYKLYYAPNFYEFLKEIDPEKALILTRADKRLVIPFTDAQGIVTSVTARSLTGAEPKYLVASFDDEALSVFGLDNVDFSQTFYGMEGSFDSMFIDNALAFGGQHYNEVFEAYISPYKDNFVVIYDNECYNWHTVQAMRKVIRDGYGLVIWPEWVEQKDINEMIKDGGMTTEEVMQIIRENTFRGLVAEARLAAWSKAVKPPKVKRPNEF